MLALAGASPAEARVPTTLELDANARAAGNDRAAAVALARTLLSHGFAAQIVKIRVDRAGAHRVAGITLSGMKLKYRVDPSQFAREANAIVDLALGGSDIEEVDLWATVPLSGNSGSVTSGDSAQATSRTVFTVTVQRVRRDERRAWWDVAWRRELEAQAP